MSRFSLHPNVRGTLLSDVEATFYDTTFSAEQTHQFADKSTQALSLAADLVKFRAIVVAANTANLPYLGTVAREAVHDLSGGV